ncbi:MAG: hypothetical protein PHZ09_04675, partial [Eubacteriales bacterium]|nr:hypothetical protein [Eubacteriales bacterium]
MKNTILLIGFYNEKALGVRYIAGALKREGYLPRILYLKAYNSQAPAKISETEYRLLEDYIGGIKPYCIALSVMS